jgi:hypothetical protein
MATTIRTPAAQANPIRIKMIGREFVMICREAAYGLYIGASDIGNSFGSHHRLLQ